jgi:tRNA pseudouridine55 synthase
VTCLFNNRVLLIDKHAGITSSDAVNRLRRITGVKKIGHSGTLDRLASGLLVMCTGGYTRLSTRFIDEGKEYLARVRLGFSTETDDSEGSPVIERTYSHISPEDIYREAENFSGEILQRPPDYSALKVGGERASDIVRSGRDVNLKTRGINISSLEISDIDLAGGYFSMKVRCSKGTYIRSLARDLGEALGSAAHIAALRRTASGGFSVDNAASLDEIEDAVKGRAECLKRFSLGPAEALEGMNTAKVSPESAARVLNGLYFEKDGAELEVKRDENIFRVIDGEENLIAIAEIDLTIWHLRYINVFHSK